MQPPTVPNTHPTAPDLPDVGEPEPEPDRTSSAYLWWRQREVSRAHLAVA